MFLPFAKVKALNTVTVFTSSSYQLFGFRVDIIYLVKTTDRALDSVKKPSTT
jgi:hypothetical protein